MTYTFTRNVQWIDSMGANVILMEGTYDEKARTLTCFSQEIDPRTREPMSARYVTEYKNNDTRIFTMAMKPKGAADYEKMMEIRYKRRKE